jgi:hypothetical protein
MSDWQLEDPGPTDVLERLSENLLVAHWRTIKRTFSHWKMAVLKVSDRLAAPLRSAALAGIRRSDAECASVQ